MTNKLRSQNTGLTQHDFSSANTNRDRVEVKQSRFNTRIRKGAHQVKVDFVCGATAMAKVDGVNGRQLTLKCPGGGVGNLEVKNIFYRNSDETAETVSTKGLINMLLRGTASLDKCRILRAFSGHPQPGLQVPVSVTPSMHSAWTSAQRLIAGSRLNASQKLAVEAILKPIGGTFVNIIQGPS